MSKYEIRKIGEDIIPCYLCFSETETTDGEYNLCPFCNETKIYTGIVNNREAVTPIMLAQSMNLLLRQLRVQK